MTEWKEYKLGEIATFSQGVQVDVNLQSYVKEDEYIRFVRIVDYTKMGEELPRYIKNPGDKYLVSEFDLVMIRYGSQTAGKVVKGICGAIANNVFKIDLNSSIADNVYVYYWLSQNSVQDYFMQSQASSTMPAITFDMIGKLEISLPPLPEQIRIASILSSLDDKIDLLHRENKTLEAMAETLFRQWFIEEAKEDDMCLLGEVIKTTSGGTPSRKNEEYYCNGNIEWVKSKELHHSYILDTEEKITIEAVHNSSAKLLPENSILIAMYGATVGEYGIIAKSMTCNQAICALIPNEKYPYTYLYLWAKFMQDEFINLACGAAQQNISQELIKQQYVSNDIKLISDFHILVNPYMEKMKVNQEQIQTLIQQRDALLPKLMSGEVMI